MFKPIKFFESGLSRFRSVKPMLLPEDAYHTLLRLP